MKAASTREFATVDEIFETYIPGYRVHAEESLDQDNVGIGVRLATDLLKDFERAIKESATVEGSDKKQT
jgi:hypothetical protein